MKEMTFEYIWANFDLKTTYWSLHMAEKLSPLYPSLPNDSASDKEIPNLLKTTIEERCYGTIPGSDTATIAALPHLRPQANTVIPRGKSSIKKKKNTTKTPRRFWYQRTHLPAILYQVYAHFCEPPIPVS